MVIKNGYEARLAKMAGDENVTIPKPTNAYMKYMDGIDLEGGGGGGSGTGWLVARATRVSDSEDSPFVLDKTARELMDAAPFVVCVKPGEGQSGVYAAGYLGRWGVVEGTYGFELWHDMYMASSLDDYPQSAGEE